MEENAQTPSELFPLCPLVELGKLGNEFAQRLEDSTQIIVQ